MKDLKELAEYLRTISTMDLWKEIGRRLNVQYGKIQMAFHAGKPSGFADIDLRVDLKTDKSEFNY